MKVVYKSLMDAIVDEETRAALNGREIDYIILNDAEREELNKENAPWNHFSKAAEERPKSLIGTVSGIKLYVYDKIRRIVS